MLFTSLSRISRLPCYVFCSCSCLLRRFVCGSINLIFWPLHTYLHQNSNNKYKVLAKARQCSICQILINTILYWYVLGKCNIFFLNVLLRINWYQYFSGWKKTILSTFLRPSLYIWVILRCFFGIAMILLWSRHCITFGKELPCIEIFKKFSYQTFSLGSLLTMHGWIRMGTPQHTYVFTNVQHFWLCQIFVSFLHGEIKITWPSLFFLVRCDFDQDNGPLSIQLTDVTSQFSVEMGSWWIILDHSERLFMPLL